MGSFLRDEVLTNLDINEESLIRISDEFIKRATLINQALPNNGEGSNEQQLVTYIIRFDNKGYRFYNIAEVLRHYRSANKIERIVITMGSAETIRSNRMWGKYLEICFDAKDPSRCNMVVSSDINDWVESSYSTLSELLGKLKSKSRFIRNGWTPFAVQIFGVIVGFILSLWAATRVAPFLKIESGFVVSFILAFLLFSNIWTYLNQQILLLINHIFPNIRLQRSGKDRLHWCLQTLIGGFVVAAALYLIDAIFGYAGSILGELIIK